MIRILKAILDRWREWKTNRCYARRPRMSESWIQGRIRGRDWS